MKSFSRLWLRTAKKITTAQQAQHKKLVKSLVVKPLKKTPTVKPVKKSVPRLTLAKPTRAPVSAPRKKSITPIAAANLPGKWLSSYFVTGMGTVPVRRMQYWLYLPSTMTNTPVPMVVMLHGCEQTAMQFAQGTRMNQLAEEKGFAVLYPQQSLSAHPNRCWAWYDDETQAGGGDVKLITGVIAKVSSSYPIDRNRVYIAGMSAGASMASIVALNHPYLIAAVGLHSGTVFGSGHNKIGAVGVMQRGEMRPVSTAIDKAIGRFGVFPSMPAILIHGQSDKIVRPVNLAQLTQQFCRLNQLSAHSGAPAVLKPAGKAKRNPAHAYIARDYLRGPKPIVRSYDILQLDHAWSGGDANLRFNSASGPNATKLIWSFFSKHRRTTRGAGAG